MQRACRWGYRVAWWNANTSLLGIDGTVPTARRYPKDWDEVSWVKCVYSLRMNLQQPTAYINAYFLSLAATRETSFVHAISAAGVMYTLARNCSLGDLDSCGCDVSRNGKTGDLIYFKRNYLHCDSVPLCTSDLKNMFLAQAARVGCGGAVALMWISGRRSPNSTLTHRRQVKTPELLSTYITTPLDDW